MYPDFFFHVLVLKPNVFRRIAEKWLILIPLFAETQKFLGTGDP